MVRRIGTSRTGAAGALVLAMSTVLATGGCESQARQDPLFVRNSTETLVFTDTQFFRDRPISDSLLSSLQLADYATALDRSGLLTLLQRPGPYTVFAVPNASLEAVQVRENGHLFSAATIPELRRTLGLTIVPGHYDEPQLRAMIAKAGRPIGLRSLYGDLLSVSVEPRTGQLLLGDAAGRTNRVWLSSMPQSNGVLFVTQSMLFPAAPATPAVVARR